MTAAKFDLVRDLEIVLITYNRRVALAHTLERVLAAESPVRDCAMTVLDNCSTDGTDALLAEAAARHPNLSVRRHVRNIGGNANIVRAFETASKKFVWVLCDDDDYDWGGWDEIREALASDAYDMVFTMDRLTQKSPRPDVGYLAFLAAFVPGCIYRTSRITDDVLQNMYAMIHTWYPQSVLSLHILCNLGGGAYLPTGRGVVIRQLKTDDKGRDLTDKENFDTLTRGLDGRLVHPDLARMYWHVGFALVAQIVTDPAKRAEVIERTRFDERWTGSFEDYCKTVFTYNKAFKGGCGKNITDFMSCLTSAQRRRYARSRRRELLSCLPVYLDISEREVELRVLWFLKFRLWHEKWFRKNKIPCHRFVSRAYTHVD